MVFTINCHCFEDCSVRSLFCCPKGPDDGNGAAAPKEEIIYTDTMKQLVILSTPEIDFPELVLYEDIDGTEVTMFSQDEKGEMRLVAVQGLNMRRSAQSDAVSPEAVNSPRGPAEGDPIAGRLLSELFPDYMVRFLKPIYQQTLNGNYLQLTVMWLGRTHLFRTFPIINHKKHVIGGISISTPYTNQLHEGLDQFALNTLPRASSKAERKAHEPAVGARRMGTRGPRQQLMASSHSGMLVSQIHPAPSHRSQASQSVAATDGR